MESSKQAKKKQITEAYQLEITDTEIKLKTVKVISQELKDLTEKYLHNVLDRTDQLEKRGHLPSGYSKDFSKQIIKLVEIVPPVEI